MTSVQPQIPVYPTLAASSFPLSSRWRRWFPFDVPGGRWTFSGRVALFHGLRTLHLPAGSTILVPNYHQGVEIDTLIAAGHTLRYYRVGEHLDIDLRDAERQLDGSVVALYVIHYFGFAQPMDTVRAFCRAHRLRLIEDCALSLFSRHNGEWLGSVGDLAIFSVYKTIPLPHGGYFVARSEASDDELASVPFSSTAVQALDLVHRTLRAAGRTTVDSSLTHASRRLSQMVRWNRSRTIESGGALWDARLLGYAASRSVQAMMRLVDPDRVVQRRRANFMRLAAHLKGEFVCPFEELPDDVCPLFFPVLVPDKERFQQKLATLGVGSVNLWDASHPTCPPPYAAEVAHWRTQCLELPIHQELSEEAIDRVAAAALTVKTGVAWATRGTT